MEKSVKFGAKKARKRLMPLALRQWHLYRLDILCDPNTIDAIHFSRSEYRLHRKELFLPRCAAIFRKALKQIGDYLI